MTTSNYVPTLSDYLRSIHKRPIWYVRLTKPGFVDMHIIKKNMFKVEAESFVAEHYSSFINATLTFSWMEPVSHDEI